MPNADQVETQHNQVGDFVVVLGNFVRIIFMTSVCSMIFIGDVINKEVDVEMPSRT